MKAIFILIIISLFNVCLNKKQWWHGSKVIEFTSENITDYLGSDKYIILQFYTKWCVDEPSKMPYSIVLIQLEKI